MNVVFTGQKELDGHPTQEYVAWLEAQLKWFQDHWNRTAQPTPHVRAHHRRDDDHIDYPEEDERY